MQAGWVCKLSVLQALSSLLMLTTSSPPHAQHSWQALSVAQTDSGACACLRGLHALCRSPLLACRDLEVVASSRQWLQGVVKSNGFYQINNLSRTLEHARQKPMQTELQCHGALRH